MRFNQWKQSQIFALENVDQFFLMSLVKSKIFSQFFPGEVPRFRRRKVLMPGPEIRSGGPLVAFAEKRVVDFFGLKMGLLLWSKNGLL